MSAEVLQKLGFNPAARLEPAKYGHQRWDWWELKDPAKTSTKTNIRIYLFAVEQPDAGAGKIVNSSTDTPKPHGQKPANIIEFPKSAPAHSVNMEQQKQKAA